MTLTQEQQRAMAIAAARRRAAEDQAAGGQAAQPAPAPQRTLMQNILIPYGMASPQEASEVMQNTRDFVVGDDDPNNLTSGEYIAELLNAGGEAASLGLVGDEAAAGMDAALGRGSYDDRLDHRRGQEDLAREESPLAYGAAQIGGGLMGALAAPIGTLGRGASLSSRLAAGGASGAGMGGAYGFMEGEGGAGSRMADAGQGAAIGLGAGLVAPLIGAGVQRVADARAGNRAIQAAAQGAPSTEELRAMGRAAYQQIDDAGVQVRPDVVRGQLDDLRNYLREQGAAYTGAESVMPASRAMYNAADEVGQGANTIPFRELDVFRRFAGNAGAANPQNRVDSRNSAEIVGRLDDFVQGLGADDVDAGDLQTLQEVLPRARELWARMSRSQTVDDAIEASENYLSGPASGLRNQFRRIVSNPRLSRGFSDAELQVMRRVSQGSIPERILYNLGSGMGQIGSAAVGGTVGAIGGGPVASLAGAMTGAGISGGLSRAAESVARRNAEVARAIIANGRLPNTLPVASDASRRIAEQLMLRGGATAGAQ